MKTYIYILLIIISANCANAQGVTKNGKMTTNLNSINQKSCN